MLSQTHFMQEIPTMSYGRCDKNKCVLFYQISSIHSTICVMKVHWADTESQQLMGLHKYYWNAFWAAQGHCIPKQAYSNTTRVQSYWSRI